MAVITPGKVLGDAMAAAHPNGTLREVDDNPISDADLKLVGKIQTLFATAKRFRKPLVAQWVKNYRILRNRTWISARADWLPSPEVPEIYPIVCSMVGWMTDQRPMFELMPAAWPHSPWYEYISGLAYDLQTTLHSIYHTQLVENEIEKLIWDGLVYGTGFLKVTWDDALDDGMGNVAIKRVDPFTFYPDPGATSLSDANYFIEARKMSLQELDRRWPGAAELFPSGATENVDEAPNRLSSNPSGPPRANPGAISPSTSPRYGLPGQSRMNANEPTIDSGVVVLECWMRDHDVDKSDPDDISVHDYWKVVVVAGNRVLMNERAEDLWSHSRHPYVRWVPHETGEFWGNSLVEMLAPSQLSINRILASIQLNIELTGNPVFKEGARSGLQRTKITNKPGQRVTIAENSTGEWLTPPPIQSNMPDMLRFYIAEMERVSGLSAITRGATPSGRNSEGVLDSVQEASFVRVRMALRQLEYTLREAGTLACELITEFYDTPRFIAAVGPDGQQASLALKGNHFYVPSQGENGGRQPMKFAVLVNAGSQLPTSSTARRQDAVTLFGLGALDVQAVLEAFNWPNRMELVKRIQAAQAAGTFQPPGARQRSQRSS